MESNMNHKPREQAHTKQQPARPQGDTNPPPEAPAAPRFQATAARPRAAPTETRPPTPTRRDTANEDDAPARESLTAKASAAGGGDGEKVGVGAFGPAVGLSVVAAVSMAGLLGGRLWAVACVCAWVAALSRLQRPEAPVAAGGGTARSDGGEGLVVGVDSRDHKKLVVLRGLFERDRTKAVTA